MSIPTRHRARRAAWLPLLAALAAPAMACEPLQVTDAWVREMPPGARVTAGYLTLSNAGAEPLQITGVASSGFARAEFHEMRMTGDRMSMQQLDRLTVPAGGNLSLAPGGLHLMLFEPRATLREGQTVGIELQCGKQRRHLNLPVRRATVAK